MSIHESSGFLKKSRKIRKLEDKTKINNLI